MERNFKNSKLSFKMVSGAATQMPLKNQLTIRSTAASRY
ncbi:hypothetical protein LIMU106485_07795 [Limosilactobacillus mucosae]